MSRVPEFCACMEDPDFFDNGPMCKNCPWRLVAGAKAGYLFYMERRDFIDEIVESLGGVVVPEIYDAIVRQYCCTRRSARRAYRRACENRDGPE